MHQAMSALRARCWLLPLVMGAVLHGRAGGRVHGGSPHKPTHTPTPWPHETQTHKTPHKLPCPHKSHTHPNPHSHKRHTPLPHTFPCPHKPLISPRNFTLCVPSCQGWDLLVGAGAAWGTTAPQSYPEPPLVLGHVAPSWGAPSPGNYLWGVI